MKTPSVILIGIGGYGNLYANELLRLSEEGKCIFCGAVDPFPQSATAYVKLVERGIKIYSTPEECYNEITPDLCCISAPIQFHTPYTMLALSHGSNVICEKPLSAVPEDAETITKYADEHNLFVMSGYQWSHSNAILSLKKDILSGKLGSPISMKTIVLWPRRQSYFKRGSGWAGKKYAPDGTPIFDSVANNAAAHYLHNMLYLLGDSIDSAAVPTEIDAELFRANPIENFDTSLIRVTVESGAEALFIASHAIEKNVNPRFEYTFENGTVYYAQDSSPNIVAKLNSGEEIVYGNPFERDCTKIELAVQNASVDADERFIPCSAKTAGSHTKCISAIKDCDIVSFTDDMINVIDAERDPLRCANGLAEVLEKCYADCKLISETAENSEIGKITRTYKGIKVK